MPVDDAAALALQNELKDIQTNSNNPLHTGYKNNDPGVSKQIDEKYAKVYGSEKVELAKGITIGEAVKTQEEKDQEWHTEELTKHDTEMRMEWGDAFEANSTSIKDTAGELLKTAKLQMAFDNVAVAYVSLGGDMADLSRLMHTIDKWRRGVK